MAQSCYFEFALPRQPNSRPTRFQKPCRSKDSVQQLDLILLPQQTATIPIKITLPSPAWSGAAKQTHYFTLTAAELETGSSRMVLGQIQQRPLIGPGLGSLMVGLGGVLAGLLLWQSGWFSYNPKPVAFAARAPKPTETPYRPYWVDHPTPPTVPPLIQGGEGGGTLDRSQLGYEAIFQEVATRYNLDWRILAATAQVESHLNPYALGNDGDMGLMQIIPKTWQEWAVKANADVNKPYDPYNNVQVGAAYLAYLQGYCQARGYTDIRWALVAYNWGPQNISRLAAKQGTWDDVPAKQQLYAMRIIYLSSTVSSFLPTPTTKNLTPNPSPK